MRNIVLLILLLFLNINFCTANELLLDAPDFPNAEKQVKNATNNIEDSTIDTSIQILDNVKSKSSADINDVKNDIKSLTGKGKRKLEKTKESINNTILKTTGKPTDESISRLSRKQRLDMLEKYKNSGYYGTLPNIEREFEYIKQTSSKTSFQNKYKDTLIDEVNLKKAPLNDDLFLDVILKKEKDTQYIKDVLRFIPLLQKFKECISNNCNIQHFNANVNLVDLYARRLEKDYSGTFDASSESYYLIRNVAYLSKLQGNLKYEANFYSKYMPLSDSIYSNENIAKKDYELLLEIDKTIFALQQLK